jgi:hypothetical protein
MDAKASALLSHASFFRTTREATYSERSDDSFEDPERGAEGVDAVEEGLLTLLEILVVGRGETFEGHHEARHLSEDPTWLSSEKLEGVGVFLQGEKSCWFSDELWGRMRGERRTFWGIIEDPVLLKSEERDAASQLEQTWAASCF